MNPAVKIFLYIALTAGLVWFGRAAFQAGADAPAPAGGGTNQPASTNLVTTNAAVTNLVATNAVATNSVAVGTEEVREHRSSERLGRMMTCGFLAFGALVGLGLLVGRDVSAYLASRAENFVYNDNLVGVRDPQYDEAEEAWKRGQHLEAIQLMRDFLKKNPSEQYAALRIAEIYEKDLGNHLAAALEYEEVLKKRLPYERWGWAAIHLANLYSGKLNKPQPAEALLRRIIHEHGRTAAAKKARERLGLPEPVEAPPAEPPPPPPEEPQPEEPGDPGPKLPPGFRRMK